MSSPALAQDSLPPVEPCPSLDELRARKKFAESEGWEVLPFDTPEEGIVGYHTIRGEEARRFGFFLFGSRLKPVEDAIRDLDAFKDALAGHEGHDTFEFHQWPTSRQLGFVCYCGAEHGASRVVKIPMTALRPEQALSKRVYEKSRENLGPWMDRPALRRLSH